MSNWSDCVLKQPIYLHNSWNIQSMFQSQNKTQLLRNFMAVLKTYFWMHRFHIHFVIISTKYLWCFCFWQAVNRCLTTCLLSQTKITTYSLLSHFPTFHSPSLSLSLSISLRLTLSRNTLGPPFLFVYMNSAVSFPLFRGQFHQTWVHIIKCKYA